MSGNTINVQGSYIDIHDNEVVNLNIDKATVTMDTSSAQAPVVNTPSDSHKEIADELLALAENGDWVEGITAEDITLMLRNVLGMGEVSLTAKQAKLSNGLWLLLEKGRKGKMGRVRIIWENIVGFLDEKRLLVQKGASALDKDFFGDDKGYTNIDKGRPNSNNMPKGFREIMPLLEAFVPKLPTRR